MIHLLYSRNLESAQLKRLPSDQHTVDPLGNKKSEPIDGWYRMSEWRRIGAIVPFGFGVTVFFVGLKLIAHAMGKTQAYGEENAQTWYTLSR